MKVIRVMPEAGWVAVANTAARSREISWRAKGLLLELLSYPPDNDVTIDKLVDRGRAARLSGRVAEGREAMRYAMRELEQAGYLVRDKRRDKATGHWATDLFVCDVPEVLAGRLRGTALPSSVDWASVERASGDQSSVGRALSTSKTEENTEDKTGDEKAGHQHSSALAGARAGQHASSQDRRRDELDRLYEAADKLDDQRLRRHLLAFERKRPQVYRECRQSALSQLGQEPGGKELLAGERGVRVVDLLSFKYALLHYEGRLPVWLVRLPRSS